MSLYNLANDYVKIQEMATDSDNFEMFQDTLDAINDEIEIKAENIAKLIKMLEIEISGYEAEEKRCSEKKKQLKNRVDSLKRYLENTMIFLNKKKFKSGLFSFNIQKNPASLEISDNAVIPSIYYIEQEAKLDKTALKNAIKEGLELEGVSLVQTESLRIK